MSLLDGLRYRFRALLRPGAWQRERDEEARFHLDLETMQRRHEGLSEEEAAFAARRRYGNRVTINEERRIMAGLGFFDIARQDIRFALKSFRRTPGFTAVAVLTLALGIGATTAIFSAVNSLLLRPLPFPEPDRLMQVGLTVPASDRGPARDNMVWSYPKYAVFRDQQQSFQQVGLHTWGSMTLTVSGEPERNTAEYTAGGYFAALGIRPTLGRLFLPEEDLKPGGPKVVLLGDVLWKRRFNAEPGIVGRVVDIEKSPYTVVGVLPAGFTGLSGRADFWVPIASAQPGEMQPDEAWSHSFTLIGRLKPGVTPARALEEARVLGGRVDATYPDRHGGPHLGAMARPLDALRVDPKVRRSLIVLLGAVVLVLLIACANVANLFLVRASARRREIAVRLAVGAGRRRLVRQLLTESVLLSVLGGLASVLIAWGGVRILSTINPANALRAQNLGGLGVVSFENIHLNLTAFGFAALVTLLTGLAFGLIPALQATRPSLTAELKEGTAPEPRGGLLRRWQSRNLLAAAEIALALVLLAGSGLMLRSLSRLLAVDPGVRAEGVLTLRLNTPPDLGRDSLPDFYDRLLERLGAIPGVTSAGLSDCPPLNGGCNSTGILFRDRPPVPDGTEPDVGVHWISPEWPKAVQMPLLRGRLFTRGDRLGVQKVVLVSETAARRLWPGQDAVGHPVSVGQGGFWTDTAYVAGVVGDVRYGTIDTLPYPEVYISYYQSPRGRMMIYLRTAGDPLALAAPARAVVHELAPAIPVYDIRTLASRTADAMSYARFSTILLVLFGIVALALATLGTYGVVSFGVAQRTREFGIRAALGASRGDVTRLVLAQGAGLAAGGGAVGLLAAFAATRVLRSQLYDVAPTDPGTFAGIVVLLAVAIVAACWLPARRATAVPPTEALREG